MKANKPDDALTMFDYDETNDLMRQMSFDDTVTTVEPR